VKRENVEFQSDGPRLKGHFYTPERVSPPYPAVVMAGGWCYVKELMDDDSELRLRVEVRRDAVHETHHPSADAHGDVLVRRHHDDRVRSAGLPYDTEPA